MNTNLCRRRYKSCSGGWWSWRTTADAWSSRSSRRSSRWRLRSWRAPCWGAAPWPSSATWAEPCRISSPLKTARRSPSLRHPPCSGGRHIRAEYWVKLQDKCPIWGKEVAQELICGNLPVSFLLCEQVHKGSRRCMRFWGKRGMWKNVNVNLCRGSALWRNIFRHRTFAFLHVIVMLYSRLVRGIITKKIIWAPHTLHLLKGDMIGWRLHL